MDGGAAFLELVFLDLKAKKFVKLRENLQYLVESNGPFMMSNAENGMLDKI